VSQAPWSSTTLPDEQPLVALPSMRGDDTTRALCSAVLAHEGFGDAVHRDLCVPTVRALPPCPGVQLTTVARYAAWAQRERHQREVGLALLLAVLVLDLSVMVLAGIPALFPLALMIVAGMWVWRAGCEFTVMQAAVAALQTGRPLDRGGGLLSPEREAVLAEANEATVSVYSQERHDPFPGLGEVHQDFGMPAVLASKPKDPEAPITPITPAIVHRYLVKAIPQLGFREIETRNVVHVAGSWLHGFQALLPHPAHPPVTRASAELIDQVADQPREALRTYSHARIVGHGGNLVNTLDVRIRLEGGVLSWDIVVHQLGPIRPEYRVAAGLPTSPGRLLWLVGRHPRTSLFKALAAAPGSALRRRRQIAAERPAQLVAADVLHDAVQRRLDIYGSGHSVREHACRGTSLNFQEHTDARDQVTRLVTAVYRAVVECLVDNNVDVAELVEQEREAVTKVVQTMNFNGPVGSVVGQAGQVR
jgi:hypothetical protein